MEVTERLPASHGLVGCCTLAIGGPSQHVPVKVFNLSEETLRIHKNQSLAEFTETTTSINATTGPPDVDKITTGNHLTDEQSRRLQHLLCKYQTVFAYDGNEGRTSTIEHTIKLTDDTPVASRYRRTPSGWRHESESEIQRLRNNGVIRSSTSSYAAPICPVKKKDGTMRLCIDYRQLNARTKSDAFSTGNVLDVIDNMAGARYFSTIDLAQGYHQVPVAEADREKTAFRTSSGLWEFTRMPFGLKGALATFCRLMARVLGHMSPTHLALYMNDICVISATFDSHLERLEATFKNLLVHYLRIKAHKNAVSLWRKSSSVDTNLAARGYNHPALNWTPSAGCPFHPHLPKSKLFSGRLDGTESLLGTTPRQLRHDSYPSHKTNTGGSSIQLDARVPNSVQNIKTTIDEVTVAKSRSSGRHSHSDNECLYRRSGCRTRSGDTRRDTSCRIFSRAMTKTERNYSKYDRQLLAIVSTIWHFCHHLLGRRFVLWTDHRPLQYFPITRDP